jgi:hypothetical protein
MKRLVIMLVFVLYCLAFSWLLSWKPIHLETPSYAVWPSDTLTFSTADFGKSIEVHLLNLGDASLLGDARSTNPDFFLAVQGQGSSSLTWFIPPHGEFDFVVIFAPAAIHPTSGEIVYTRYFKTTALEVR